MPAPEDTPEGIGAASRLLRAAWQAGGAADSPEVLAAAATVLRPPPVSADAPPPVPYTAVALGRAAGVTARAAGGGGTALPGKVLLSVVPGAIARMAARLEHGVILVSGTNGKTTTASMIAAIAQRAGYEVVHNRAGANTHWGVATALVEQSGQLGVLEVDEAWLLLLAPHIRPRMIVFGNLFRDRLDGYGEVEVVAGAWQRLAAAVPSATLVLNADDALVSGLGAARSGAGGTVHFGIDDVSVAQAERDHAADALHCRGCGGPYRFGACLMGHLGHYHCPACGDGRSLPEIAARSVTLDGLENSSATIETPAGSVAVRLGLAGLYNVYNALAATAAATTLGIGLETVRDALPDVAPPFGRGERLTIAGREILILLTKNPAGTNEVLRTLARDGGPHDLLLALNDRYADGRDVSWIWDVDFEHFAPQLRTVTCAGTRAAELALRLRYAGWPAGAIEVEEGIGDALDRGLARAAERLVTLPTYTALLELRTLLAERGHAAPYWA